MLSELVHQYYHLSRQIKELEEQKEELRMQILSKLKEPCSIVVPHKNVEYLVELKEITKQILDTQRLKKENPQIYNMYQKELKTQQLTVSIERVIIEE